MNLINKQQIAAKIEMSARKGSKKASSLFQIGEDGIRMDLHYQYLKAGMLYPV